ncbi:MAG: phosphotransferase [Caulobacter sp.]
MDAAGFILLTDHHAPYFLKLYHPGEPGFDINQAAVSSQRAGELNIGPQLLAADAALGVQLFAYMGAPWRPASASDFDAPTTRANAARLLKRWHAGAPLGALATSTDQWIQQTQATFGDRLAILMPAWGVLRTWAERIADALNAAGHDPSPLHGEVYISNFLVGADEALALVDFDHAADGDAYADLGALALDVCEFDADYDQLVEAYAGAARRDLVARTKLQAVLEDFRWGCAMLLQHRDPQRQTLTDFLGYGRMRHGRCLSNLQTFDIASLLGDL